MAGTGIEFHVLGDYGPFSEQGKSIGYHVFINGDNYLVDLGAPLFQQIGGAGIGRINGAIITHCHDDHKRWFTDMALYYMYSPAIRRKLKLCTTDTVAHEVKRSAGPSLNQSLDAKSRKIVDISYDDYVEHLPLGPRARYSIVSKDNMEAGCCWHVVDSAGNMVGPEKAKVVISTTTGKPRMLFRDPELGEWVEPESFYPFSSTVFYEDNQRCIEGEGYRITIINAPVWHGISNFGVVFETEQDRLIFGSDTMHNLTLWKSLCEERLEPSADIQSCNFLDASVLSGDINDYIQRTWSRQRYDDALSAFKGAAVVHDITGRFGVVHTEYHGLSDTALDPARTLLTHSPDQFSVLGWKLMKSGKRYRVIDNAFQEIGHDGSLWPIDADIYHKSEGRFFSGYRHPEGRFYVYEKDRYHTVHNGPDPDRGELLFRVNLFEDLNGIYLPHQGIHDQFYLLRPDGKAELVHRDEEGSHGILVNDLRARRHVITPEELDRLAQRRVDMPEYEKIQSELRELQRTLAAMRDRLELQVFENQETVQQNSATAQAEIFQLREAASVLREELEKERAVRDTSVSEALKVANAEIVQLRETASALREEMENKGMEAANMQMEAVSAAQSELLQLRSTVASLREQLDSLRK